MRFILFMLLCVYCWACSSCSSKSGKRARAKTTQPVTLDNREVYRIKVLENNHISWIRLSTEQRATLRPLDTIWVNVAKHEVDELYEYGMLAVIYN